MKYTKAFEDYWSRVNVGVNLPEIPWVYPRIKRIAFNAWKASRKSIVHLNRSAVLATRERALDRRGKKDD